MEKIKKIKICLLHNNEKDRLNYIRPKIDSLVSEISKKHLVSFDEISEQNEKDINIFELISRDIFSFKLQRKYKKYIHKNNKLFMYDFLVFIFRLFKQLIFNTKKYRGKRKIEMIVSEKHVQAYLKSIEYDADFLIIFENDAIFKENSIKKILETFDLELNLGAFIDLAGGYSFGELNYQKILSKTENGFLYFSKPVTNTACAYILNKKQIQTLIMYILKYKNIRQQSIDWLLNAVFIRQTQDKIDVQCLHSDPSILNHGSFTGEFNSWTTNI
jgi:hypothetical protein